jgi:membrane-associated phospholipid phosphatase
MSGLSSQAGMRTPAGMPALSGPAAGRAARVLDTPRARQIAWLAACTLLMLSVWLDPWAYRLAHAGKDAVEPRAWYQIVRTAGTLWFWIPVGLAVGLARPGAWRRRVRAALWVLFAALVAGVAAELLKVVVGRERPLLHDGSFVFRPLTGWLSNAGMSFPSSHAAVAFGGAWMVWRLARGESRDWAWAGWAALAIAGACGVCRMLTGAHFLADVVGAALAGAVAAAGVHRLITPALARRWPEVCLLRRRWAARPRPAPLSPISS